MSYDYLTLLFLSMCHLQDLPGFLFEKKEVIGTTLEGRFLEAALPLLIFSLERETI
jgi:hypothetical protein